MTIRKTNPPRSYETFSSNSSDAGAATPQTSTSSGTKSRSAAEEAQRLASQGSWGDNYINGTPITNATPAASTVDETEDRYGDRRNDPPPQYTPTDTVHTASLPSSPTAARQPPEPVRQTSSPSQSSPPPVAGPDADHEEDQPMPGAYTPSSPLLESGEPTYSYNNLRWSKDTCKSHRYRRCKKACWFTFALALCLWLMLPVLWNCDKVVPPSCYTKTLIDNPLGKNANATTTN